MKTNIFFFLSLLIIATFFISCEANKLISVRVINSKTLQPLDSVFVEVNAGKNDDFHKSTAQGYTDTAGKFETHLMIGCSFGCYDIYTKYSKKGYEDKTDFNITEGTVMLKPK